MSPAFVALMLGSPKGGLRQLVGNLGGPVIRIDSLNLFRPIPKSVMDPVDLIATADSAKPGRLQLVVRSSHFCRQKVAEKTKSTWSRVGNLPVLFGRSGYIKFSQWTTWFRILPWQRLIWDYGNMLWQNPPVLTGGVRLLQSIYIKF